MKKLISGLVAIVLLGGCDSDVKNEKLVFPQVPDSLKNCEFHRLQNADYDTLTVVTCPNANTQSSSYRVGKKTETAVVVENPQPTRTPMPNQKVVISFDQNGKMIVESSQ